MDLPLIVKLKFSLLNLELGVCTSPYPSNYHERFVILCIHIIH
jgi:hypothetical protein